MISVERIQNYIDTKPETNNGKIFINENHNNNTIELQNLSVKYREDLPIILKKINIKVNGNIKVGIIGRTGSGKSSFLLSLLQLNEISEGNIKIGE